jgi:predicted hotdog family 3-hydroxylacyl-ACP dehydratase
MHLNRDWIERHLPHQGRMCLLDEVLEWSSAGIRCRAGTHRDTEHPLRTHGRLGSVCGIEYAAQAMALHGALLDAGAAPRSGFLASVRAVRLHVLRLDDVAGDLLCEATRVAGDIGTALYEFAVHSQARTLLTGRATVVLDANERLTL